MGGIISGMVNRPDCLDASIASLLHLSSFSFSLSSILINVLLKIVGRIRSAPSSVDFSISQSIRGPLIGLTQSVTLGRFSSGR